MATTKSATTKKRATVKTAPAKKAAPKKAAPKKAATKRAPAKKAAPKNTATKKAVPKNTATKKAVPKNTAIKKPAPRKRVAKKVVEEEVIETISESVEGITPAKREPSITAEAIIEKMEKIPIKPKFSKDGTPHLADFCGMKLVDIGNPAKDRIELTFSGGHSIVVGGTEMYIKKVK